VPKEQQRILAMDHNWPPLIEDEEAKEGKDLVPGIPKALWRAPWRMTTSRPRSWWPRGGWCLWGQL